MGSKSEIVRRIEQIDHLLTCLQELRRFEMFELEKIEAKEII
jgi:hypothetical protein